MAVPLTALAMFGFFNVMKGNRALAEARIELARLAAESGGAVSPATCATCSATR